MARLRRDSNGAAWRRARARVLHSQDVCGLCGKPVDKSLPWLHPYSAQVDHIIPVSQGGHPTMMSNLQLAHRACNMRKGDGSRAAPTMRTSRAW